MKNILVFFALIAFVFAMIPVLVLAGDVKGDPEYMLGDVNGDGQVCGTTADAVYLLNWYYYGGPPPICMAACDADEDGIVDNYDAVKILNICFSGHPAPDGWGECAVNDTELSCEYSACNE